MIEKAKHISKLLDNDEFYEKLLQIKISNVMANIILLFILKTGKRIDLVSSKIFEYYKRDIKQELIIIRKNNLYIKNKSQNEHHFGLNMVGNKLMHYNLNLKKDPSLPKNGIGLWLNYTSERY